MKWFSSKRRPSRPRVKTIPNLEPLETRWVPSSGLAITHGPLGLRALPRTTDHGNPTVGHLPGNGSSESLGQRPGSGVSDLGDRPSHSESATAQSGSNAKSATAKASSHTQDASSHDGSATTSKGKTKTTTSGSGTTGGSVARKLLNPEPPGTTEGSGGRVGDLPPGGNGGTVGNLPPGGNGGTVGDLPLGGNGGTVGKVSPGRHDDSHRNERSHITPRAGSDDSNHKAARAHSDSEEQSTTTAPASPKYSVGSRGGTVTTSKGTTKTSTSGSSTSRVSVPGGPKFQPPRTTEHGGYTVGNQPGDGSGVVGTQPGDGGGVVGIQPGNASLGLDGGRSNHGSAAGQSASKSTSAKAKANSHTHTRGSHHGTATASKGKNKPAKASPGTWVPPGGPTFRPPGTTESGSGGNNNTNLPPGSTISRGRSRS
jgi:hypothetical protein